MGAGITCRLTGQPDTKGICPQLRPHQNAQERLEDGVTQETWKRLFWGPETLPEFQTLFSQKAIASCNPLAEGQKPARTQHSTPHTKQRSVTIMGRTGDSHTKLSTDSEEFGHHPGEGQEQWKSPLSENQMCRVSLDPRNKRQPSPAEEGETWENNTPWRGHAGLAGTWGRCRNTEKSRPALQASH